MKYAALICILTMASVSAKAAPIAGGTSIGIDFGPTAPNNNFNQANANSGSIAANSVIDTNGTVIDGLSFTWINGNWVNNDSADSSQLPGQPAVFNDSNLTDWLGENNSVNNLVLTFVGLNDELPYDLIIGSAFNANGTDVDTIWSANGQSATTDHANGANAYVTLTDLHTDGSGNLVITAAPEAPNNTALTVVSALLLTARPTAPSVSLSSDTVVSNAAPGTLVGTLSDPSRSATSFVLTNAPAGGSAADNSKFQILDGTNLCTSVWMSQYSNNVSIAAISNGVALVTNSLPIYVATATKVIFEVSAEVSSPATNNAVVGVMKVSNDSATFSIVGGRTDLFSTSGDNLVVANAESWGGVGTTNYVTLRAVNGALTNELVIAAAVVNGATSGTIFRFR